MSLSSITKYKIQSVLFIILFWIAGFNLYFLIRYYGNAGNVGPIAISYAINIQSLFMLSILGGTFMGTIIGVLEIFFYPDVVKNKPFGFGIVLRVIVFLTVFLFAVLIALRIYYMQTRDDEWIARMVLFIGSPSFYSLLIYCLVLNVTMDFILRVNQRMGPGTIWNLLNGRYFHPRQENRIFMFLDLQSSTTIAERIGHVRFSKLLQDCFFDLSTLLLKHRASIYQFVGDEAVLTWQYQLGISEANCINIYFEFEQLLLSKRDYYEEKYGVMPKFYASVNAGMVTAAEVGDIKSELAFHGDVLNAGSRIQKLCKVYNENILITESVINAQLNHMVTFLIDKIKLEGKHEEVAVYGLKSTRNDSQN